MSRRSDSAFAAVEPWVPLIVGLVTFGIASTLRHPVVFPDESAAVSSANYFAGGGARSEWWYLPGYSLLLTPVLLLTKSISTIYVGVHLVNALLAAVTSFGLLKIDRSLFPDRPPAVRALAALLVAAYPAYLYFAALAISDNLLVAGAVWSVVALLSVLDRPQTSGLILRTVAVSALLTAHSRAVPILVAWVVIVVWMVATERRTRLLVIGTGVVGAVVFSVIGRALINYQRATGLATLTRQSPRDLLSDLLGVRSLLVFPFTALGQLMYLVMASLGLIVLGVAALSKMTRSGTHRHEVISRFVLLVLVLSWILSAAFTNQGQGDLAMYGRYMEAVLVVPLFLGVVSMLGGGVPDWFRRWMPTAIVLLSCLVVGIRGYDAFNGRNQMLNVAGVAIGQRITGDLDPAIFGLMAAAAIFVLVKIRERSASLAGLALLVVFSWSTFAVFDRAIVFADSVDDRAQLVDLIDRVDSEVCVGLDQAVLTDFATQELYRLDDVERDYRFVNSEDVGEGQVLPACVGLIVTERSDLATVLPGWLPIGIENSRPQWLWVRPDASSLFERELMSPDPGQPLLRPTAELKMVVLSAPMNDSDDSDGGLGVLIELTNTTDQTFVPARNLPESLGAINLGLEWRDPAEPDVRIHEPIRVTLPRILMPGESIVLEGELMTTVSGFEADAGTWIIRVEVVQELVRWFEDDGFAQQEAIVQARQ